MLLRFASPLFCCSLAIVALAGCASSDPSVLNGRGGSGGSTSSGASTSIASDDTLQRCVDRINEYRAQIGREAYARSSALESFAADGAQSDSASGQAHGHFIDTRGGGVAFAENEVPGWPLKQFGTVNAIVDKGLQAMWDEGPGGGHYDNMASGQYTQVGCGVAETSDGAVWVTIDFR